MKLSEKMIQYRQAHGLSQRQFAVKCGVTNGTISLIESEVNPQTGKKMQPSLKTLKCIADGMSIRLHDLIVQTDDLSVYLGEYEQMQEPKTQNSGSYLAKTDTSGLVPVVDGIAAGAPILATDNIVDYIPVTVRNPEEYFYLIVRGDSMINAGIPNGSQVLIHMQPNADNGQIVACRVNGDEATLKRFKQVGDTVLLMPENPAYEPIIVPVSDFCTGEAEIIGVVKKVTIDV